jgi:hypothetical protein
MHLLITSDNQEVMTNTIVMLHISDNFYHQIANREVARSVKKIQVLRSNTRLSASKKSTRMWPILS